MSGRINELRLLLCAVALGSAAVARGEWPVYDNVGGQAGEANFQVLQGYFDGSSASAFIPGLHEGLDILGSGNGGEVVEVVRGGTVIEKSNAAGGTFAVRVDVGGGRFETDTYLHVNLTTGINVDGTVHAGDMIGTVSTMTFAAGSRHLHFDVASGTRTTNGGTTPGGIATLPASPVAMLNPYLRLGAQSDPFGATPSLSDTNKDGKTILLVRQGNTNPAAAGFAVLSRAVGGGIDIIADARDAQNGTLLSGAGVFQIGYSIQALFNQEVVQGEVPRHNVKSPAAPYLLARFDDSWAGGTPAMGVLYADPGPGSGTINSPLRVAGNTTIFPETRQYIVTNTKGSSGAPGNAVGNQYWKTNARDDNSADGADTANGAGMGDAAHNAEARFSDGDYGVTIFMGDAAGHNHSESPGKVRVDNFRQTSSAGLGGGAPPAAFLITPLLGSGLRFLPGHGLAGESAGAGPEFGLGDVIGASGQEYYPDLLMEAWIFPHQAEWKDGEAYPAPIAAGFVMSDGEGVVPLTRLWTARETGTFDLLIDYDRDERFSATLDGLSSFTVVPEPGGLAVMVLAGLGLGRGRTRRSRFGFARYS